MKHARYPAGWDEACVRKVLEHYESQTEDEAVAEDEAAFESQGQTVMVVPRGLVPELTGLIEQRRARRVRGRPSPKGGVARAGRRTFHAKPRGR